MRDLGRKSSLGRNGSTILKLCIAFLTLLTLILFLMKIAYATPENLKYAEKIVEKVIEKTVFVQKKPKGFHFVFNSDCSTLKQNWLSFNLFTSFLTFYDVDSGSTMTELVSCKDPDYVSPFAGKFPPHMNVITVKHFQTAHPEINDPYLPYNKPVALLELLKGVIISFFFLLNDDVLYY